MKMAPTHYLPHEELRKSNYPEVASELEKINRIIEYSMVVDTALYQYNKGVANKIDVDIVKLKEYTELCREVSEVLSSASNVCYDLLLELRNFQLIFQDLLFIKLRFGSEYISRPTKNDNDRGIG